MLSTGREAGSGGLPDTLGPWVVLLASWLSSMGFVALIK